MPIHNYEFTSNEEIEAFHPGNVMMELCGYIDLIENLREVKTFQKYVFKVRLNNSKGKKIMVVFWSDNAVTWSKKLNHNDVLEIDGGTIGSVDFKYYKGQEKTLNPYDFHVQKESIVKIKGTFDGRKRQREPIQTYTDCAIKDVLSVDGPIGVTAYLKKEFRHFKKTPEGEPAHGILADDIFILCTEIEDFEPNEKLIKGVHVKMVGRIETTKPGAPMFKVENMKNVYIHEDDPRLNDSKLKLAINVPPEDSTKTPKRSLEENEKDKEKQNDDKKMKVD